MIDTGTKSRNQISVFSFLSLLCLTASLLIHIFAFSLKLAFNMNSAFIFQLELQSYRIALTIPFLIFYCFLFNFMKNSDKIYQEIKIEIINEQYSSLN